MKLQHYYQSDFPLTVTLAASDPEAFELEGYASVFGSVNSYGFVIDAGAFGKTLQENPNPVMLWHHQSDEPIGVVTSAEEDKRGLKIAAKLVPEVERARSAHALVKAQAVRGLSIGFYVIKSSYEREKEIDHVTEVKLQEVSLVTFPADPKAKVSRVLSDLDLLTARDVSRDTVQATIARLTALLETLQPDHSTAAPGEPHLDGLIAAVRERTSALRSTL